MRRHRLEQKYIHIKGESSSQAIDSNNTHDHIIFLVAMPLPTHILLKFSLHTKLTRWFSTTLCKTRKNMQAFRKAIYSILKIKIDRLFKTVNIMAMCRINTVLWWRRRHMLGNVWIDQCNKLICELTLNTFSYFKMIYILKQKQRSYFFVNTKNIVDIAIF